MSKTKPGAPSCAPQQGGRFGSSSSTPTTHHHEKLFLSKHHSERPANRPTTIITPHSLCRGRSQTGRFRFANKSKTEPDANEFKPGTSTKPPTLLRNAGWGTHLRVCNRAERSAELRRGDYLKPKTLKTFTQKSSPTESRWTFPPARSHSPASPRAHRSQIPAGSARISHSAAICPRLRTANACR